MSSYFFQDRESKILQLERQLHEQSGRLLTLGSPRSDILTTENGMEPGGNLTWLFVIQITFCFLYENQTAFVCRSYRQDDEESQRRTAETMHGER